MSRSYKKNPGYSSDKHCSHKNKHIAGGILRARMKRGIEVSDGNAYKRHYCSWNIKDYRWIYFSVREIMESGDAKAGTIYRLFMK